MNLKQLTKRVFDASDDDYAYFDKSNNESIEIKQSPWHNWNVIYKKGGKQIDSSQGLTDEDVIKCVSSWMKLGGSAYMDDKNPNYAWFKKRNNM